MRSQLSEGEIQDREFLSGIFGRIRLFWRPRDGTQACCLCGWHAFCCNLKNQQSTNPLAVEIAKSMFPKFFKLFSKLRPAVPGE